MWAWPIQKAGLEQVVRLGQVKIYGRQGVGAGLVGVDT